MAVASLSSVAGVLALLDEDDPALQEHALRKLHLVVDSHWAEAADRVAAIEALAEEDGFRARHLAAAVASKCFYHLEEYGEALRLALSAGEHFNVEERSEYVERIVGECIDEYCRLRSAQAADPSAGVVIDARLEEVVNRMFARCYGDGSFEQAIGVALEARRLDVIREAVDRAGRTGSETRAALLRYTFAASQSHVVSRSYRLEVLRLLSELHRTSDPVDHLAATRCLQALEDASGAADVLEALCRQDHEAELHAYQVAFDLVEDDNQRFLAAVVSFLQTKRRSPESGDGSGGGGGGGEGGLERSAGVEGEEGGDSAGGAEGEEGEEDTGVRGGEEVSEEVDARLGRLCEILSGMTSLRLYLHVLSRLNQADVGIMRRIKGAQARFNPVTHHAAVVSHALMQAGTTSDDFLRDNTAWLGKATNWSKFSAIAGQGVIHKGHIDRSRTILEPYLPVEGEVAGSPYLEGGGLYALGLIHANRGTAEGGEVNQYLLRALGNTQNEIVQHGACLGLGLAAMGTGDASVYRSLRNIVHSDSAVAGEAAGTAVGLVLLGQGPGWSASAEEMNAVMELMGTASESAHVKTTRGIALGLALSAFGTEDAADVLTEQMCRDEDPVMRYGGMLATGLAYAGTGRRAAVRRLLHSAVSDVADDVRRCAVFSLGFVLCRQPAQVPSLVALLAESFNPHVRYGAAMAVGIACAGTAAREAISLLDPLLKDDVDFVRQGACMAMALVLQQESEERTPKVKEFRKHLFEVIEGRQFSSMAKFGAIIATGILDAGGRNSVVRLTSGVGFLKMSAVVGMAVFLQYWYWFPFLHFLSLALHPTALVGLTRELRIAKRFSAVCHARPSLFAYPTPIEEKKDEAKSSVTKVELSVTVKARQKARKRAIRRAKSQRSALTRAGSAATDLSSLAEEIGRTASSTTAPIDRDGDAVDDSRGGGEEEGGGEDEEGLGAASSAATSSSSAASSSAATSSSSAASPTKGKKKKKTDKESEPTSFSLSNPARVTPSQRKFVALRTSEQRYVPLRDHLSVNLGVVMLRDTEDGAEDDQLEDIRAPEPGEEGDELEPPEPFEWIIDDE